MILAFDIKNSHIIMHPYLNFGIKNALYKSVKGGVCLKTIEVKVQSETGLHARPASLLVSEASKYASEIKLIKNDRTVNGKSIMGVLSLGVTTGETLIITAEGPDEENAMECLKALFDQGL